MGKPGAMSGDKMGSPEKDKMDHHNMMSGKINVKSVKMLSASCM
jgi:hypothetical protein